MSHEATSWAVKLRGLKPTTKIILWHLCDRHNPDLGCFPSQVRLAHDAEVSRSTLNLHLDELEEAGLIRRVKAIDPATKRQQNTRYILAFETDFIPNEEKPCPKTGHGTATEHRLEPCPNTGHGAVSEKTVEPCPKSGESRVRISDTNLVREPLREPVMRAGAREGVGEDPIEVGSPSENQGAGQADDFDAFWSAYPDPVEREAAKRAFAKLIQSGEVKASDLVDAAKAYARSRHVERGYGKKPANWLSSGAWREEWEAGRAAQDESREVDYPALAQRWRGPIKAGATYAASAVSQRLARFMLGEGMVTEADLRRCGVSF